MLSGVYAHLKVASSGSVDLEFAFSALHFTDCLFLSACEFVGTPLTGESHRSRVVQIGRLSAALRPQDLGGY